MLCDDITSLLVHHVYAVLASRNTQICIYLYIYGCMCVYILMAVNLHSLVSSPCWIVTLHPRSCARFRRANIAYHLNKNNNVFVTDSTRIYKLLTPAWTTTNPLLATCPRRAWRPPLSLLLSAELLLWWNTNKHKAHGNKGLTVKHCQNRLPHTLNNVCGTVCAAQCNTANRGDGIAVGGQSTIHQ